MELKYSKEITDRFLNLYKELEGISTNDNKKYEFLINKYRNEYEMFRHMRNELAHNSVNREYPFVVSNDVCSLLERMIDEVKTKAFNVCKRGDRIVSVNENKTISDVIALMNKFNYSFIPILSDNGVVKGIISSDSMMNILNHREELSFNYNDLVSKYMSLFSITDNECNYYIFVDMNMDMYELKEYVENYQLKKAKLGIILITNNGLKTEKLLGILTPWDLLKAK